MDIAPCIAFGDRYSRNQYYFIVSPLQFALLAAGLLLPPWIGAGYGGKAGLWWAVMLQLLVVASLQGYTLTSLFLRIGKDDSSDAAFQLTLNFTLIQISIAGLSAAGAWFRIRMGSAGQGTAGNNRDP